MSPSHPRFLEAQADSPVLRAFVDHFGLRWRGDARRDLGSIGRAFSRLPYENLSKIVKLHACGSSGEARRLPAEVVADHARIGAGGTCFSLTATLLHIVRSLGFRAEPILADRHYGADTHCAMLVWVDGEAHLVDPGYLIVDPIPLRADTETTVATSFNDVLLTPVDRADRLTLSTMQGKQRTERLTFKLSPVDEGEFLRAWDASFDWDMMRYPVVTNVVGAEHRYLQSLRLQRRDREGVRRDEIAPDILAATVAREFGIDPHLVERALRVLARGGESLVGR